MAITTLNDLIDPEVMADMVTATVDAKIAAIPYASVDTTLQGQPGSTITVPKYVYIGDADDVAEGGEIGTSTLTTTTTTATVKKAAKGISITDEAVLSGLGDPVGEGARQLGVSIAQKVDNDLFTSMADTINAYDGSSGVISYDTIVNALDLFAEESDGITKVLFIHPHQKTQLRLSEEFKSIDKYPMQVVLDGAIGEICGCQVVSTRKISNDGTNYTNFILQMETGSTETTATAPALSIYLKRDTAVEYARDITTKTTTATADKHYTTALSNESKVIKFVCAVDGTTGAQATPKTATKTK